MIYARIISISIKPVAKRRWGFSPELRWSGK
jgi:hypothetical protein